VTLVFYPRGNSGLVVRHAAPGRLTKVEVPVCSKDGPVVIKYKASPPGSVGDGRTIVATTGEPRFVPDAGSC
jgi:hypothetical protein